MNGFANKEHAFFLTDADMTQADQADEYHSQSDLIHYILTG